MMKCPRLAGWLCLLLLFVPSVAFSATPERVYQRTRAEYKKLEASPARQRYRDNWMRVIDGFAGLAKRYPQNRRAPASLYMAGKACEGLYSVSRVAADAEKAVELYDSLAARYPKSRLADDALVRGAGIEEKVFKDYPQAYLRYKKVCTRHPRGDMLPVARRKLRELARFAPPPASKPPSDSRAAVTKRRVPTKAKGRAVLSALRFWSNPGYTRVVMDLTKEVKYSAHFLPGKPKKGEPPRIYIDLDGTARSGEVSRATPVNDGLLRRIRTGVSGHGWVRVVLDLDSFKDYKVFPLEDPFRIVVDVAGDGAGHPARGSKARSLPSGPKDGIARVLGRASEPSPLPVTLPEGRSGNRLRTIVVDPGHGGKDPGATGPDGVHEKDVTLAIAKDLAKCLRRDLGCKVILTRTTDVFIPLEERTAIANKVGADLFISIHANACPNCHIYGTETYYLNFSKNNQATAVVARENGTSLKQVGDLERILFDLMANSKINESSRLAADIQKSLVRNLSHRYSHIKNLGVRQGPFYVLLGATMPSVLVETAFISNPREESRLDNSRYCENTAAAIAKGVRNYAEAVKMIATK